MKFSHLPLVFIIFFCIVERYQAQRPSGVQNVLNIFRQVFRRPPGSSAASPIGSNDYQQQPSVSVSTVFAFPEGAYPISTAVETIYGDLPTEIVYITLVNTETEIATAMSVTTVTTGISWNRLLTETETIHVTETLTETSTSTSFSAYVSVAVVTSSEKTSSYTTTVTKTSVYDFTVTSKKTKISIRIAECRQEMEPANSDDYYFIEDPSSIIIEGAIPEPRPEPQPSFVLPMETTVSYTGSAEAIKPSSFFHKMNYNAVQPSYEITGIKAGINFID